MTLKKQQILDEIILNFVDNEILEEQAMEYVSKEEVSEAVKIKQMEYGQADTFLSRIFSHENNGYSDVSMTQSSENICENLDVDKKYLNGQFISDKSQFSSDPSKDYEFYETSHDFQVFSRENLIAQQKKHPEIYSLLNKTLSQDEIFTVPVVYYFRNGVLMRKWRPADVPADADWSVKHQIVLQKIFGQRYFLWLMKILYLAILVLPKLITNFLIIFSGYI